MHLLFNLSICVSKTMYSNNKNNKLWFQQPHIHILMAKISVLSPFLVLFMVLMSSAPVTGQDGSRRQMVPAMFIFGDSLIDNGNNNNIPSFAKANYLPYGIDFNGGPTGRFSNGYTMVDEIGNTLFPLIIYFSFYQLLIALQLHKNKTF